MLIERDELQTLIPHKGKMLLLDRIIEYNDDHSIIAEYDITKNCIFYDPAIDGVPAWAAFEFMAQAISALSGIRSRDKGEKPKLGFILSVPSMKMEIPFFKNGNTVNVRLKETDCTDTIFTFNGEAFLEGRKVMEGSLMCIEVSEEKFYTLISGGSFR